MVFFFFCAFFFSANGSCFFIFSICSRSIAWFSDRCCILLCMSENASFSISMSFFTYPKLADMFFSICFVDFSMMLDGFDVYKVL